MKKQVLFLLLLVFVSSLFVGCEDNLEPENKTNSILPDKFSVDIPSSISHSYGNLKSAQIDTIQGNEIYEHLNTFIFLGEEAAKLVEEIIHTIGYYGIDKPMTLTYVSDDDNRTKNMVVKNEIEFEGQLWDHELTITDAESELNTDGGKALQVIWNNYNSEGVKGVAILKPYNIDRIKDGEAQEAVFRIDYSELGENGYDSEMIVQISGLPLEESLVNPYSISSLKMFAGKKGDIVDVYGNSNHPNAKFFNGDVGFNWAFVAAGSQTTNLGVAEVGLPPSNLDATSRSVILEQYSIKEVFSQQIYDVWPFISDELLDAYLYNTQGPGYFDANGFIQGGVSPGDEYTELESRIEELVPYNPKDIALLQVLFK